MSDHELPLDCSTENLDRLITERLYSDEGRRVMERQAQGKTMTDTERIAELLGVVAEAITTAATLIARAETPRQPETAPEGFAFTGKFREAEDGERYLSFGGALKWTGLRPSLCKYWILRKLPTILPAPTIESVYGKPFSALTPPAGYEFVVGPDGKPEFRVLIGSRYYMGVDGVACCGLHPAPRLILREPPKPRRWVFEEEPTQRAPKKGELYSRRRDGVIVQAASDYPPHETRTILRLIERPQ